MSLRTFTALAGAFLSIGWAHSEGTAKPSTITLTTTQGRTYRQAQVTAVDPDGVRIIHQDGVAKVPYEVPSAELREKYTFDPAKAAAFREERDRKALAQEAAVARDAAAAEKEREESAYRLFRAKILSIMRTGNYDYGRLDSTLTEWIEVYTQAGETTWAKELESDRETLRQLETERPAHEAAKREEGLASENAKLQAQIDLLQQAVDESEQSRRHDSVQTTSIYLSPYYYPYWRRYYARPIVIQPPCPPVVKPPPVCPTPPPVVIPQPPVMPKPRVIQPMPHSGLPAPRTALGSGNSLHTSGLTPSGLSGKGRR